MGEICREGVCISSSSCIACLFFFFLRSFDFGFGEPEAIRVPPSPLDGHAIVLPEAHQGGGIDVLLRLKNETMIKLLEDEEFLSTGIQVFSP